jgi:nucleoside 2-deoxyribosyltransferase
MKIYLAGSISGLSYDEVVDSYKEKAIVLGNYGYDILCPMTGKTYLRNEVQFRASGYENFPVSTNHAIFERDKWMVQQCDIILADLSRSGERVSIGTMMELAWGSLLGKHTVVILPKDNVHRHAFVLEAADIVFETYLEAFEYLNDLAKGI